MKQLSQIAFALFLFTSPLLSISQDGENFKAFIKNTFETHLNGISNQGSATEFLQAFNNDMVWVDIDVSIDGRVSTQKKNKEVLSKNVNRLVTQKYITVTWEIQQIQEIEVKQNTRVANFDVKVSLYADNELISSGKNIVEVLAKKVNDTYVIQYLSVIQVADKVYKGRCFVNLQKNNPTKFTTQTTFPNGTDYESIDNEIFFVGNDKLRVVKLNQDGQNFYWNTAQGIVSKDKLGEDKIGTASDQNSVMMVILKDQKSHKCTNMIITNPGNMEKK